MPKERRKPSSVEDNQQGPTCTQNYRSAKRFSSVGENRKHFFPDELTNKTHQLRQTFKNFQKQLDEKNNKIVLLESMVVNLQSQIDDNEQYCRRVNIRFSGIRYRSWGGP